MSSSLGKILNFLARGIAGIIFPNVCMCCGKEVTEKEKQICSFCLSERFEDANPENDLSSSNILLPEGVLIQHALWKYDKGGILQDLMHQLKYERLTLIGKQLGEEVGSRAKRHPGIAALLAREETVLVPVPLHYLKFMRRGFNQAYMIARGVQKILDTPICDIKAVVRKKNTRSQTGFSLARRTENIRNAFKVKKKSVFENKLAIIVDDVFTTGATSFELSRVLLEAGSSGVLILTVAQA